MCAGMKFQEEAGKYKIWCVKRPNISSPWYIPTFHKQNHEPSELNMHIFASLHWSKQGEPQPLLLQEEEGMIY